jgi:predicted metalloprotease
MGKVSSFYVFGTITLTCLIAQPTSLLGGVPSLDPADRMARAGLTVTDVESVDRVLSDASRNLAEVWTAIFAKNRMTYRSPALKRYTTHGAARCGPDFLALNNAFYCRPEDVIWYDPIFLARLTKVIAFRTKRPAWSVPVIIVAHEWGHAVAARLGLSKLSVGTNVEDDADCYAGAATHELINAGHLPATAASDAEQVFELIAEPDSQATGSFLSIISRSHGVISERKLAFHFGATSGTSSCQSEKRYYDTLRKVQRPVK